VSTSAARLRAMRLAAQRIGVAGGSPLEVVTHLTALQGQDLGQALWAIGSRALGVTRADVRAGFDRAEYVRSWPIRGTLHVVRPDDLRMLLSLTADRTMRSTARRASDLGLDADTIASARRTTIAALQGGRSLDRDGVLARYRDAGIDPAGGRGYHLLFLLAHEGLVAWGPTGRVGQELVLLDEWAPATAPVPDRDDALGRMLVGYLRGRGPATETDAASWSKLPLRDVRRARAMAGDAVEDLGDGLLALADRPEPGGVASAHLLAGFDEYLLGYADRSGHLDPADAHLVVPGGNGVFLPMVLDRGQVVGTWTRTERARDVRVVVTPFVPFTDAVARSVGSAAARYGRFVGLPVVTDVVERAT
jgi:hypothetical protein